MKRFFQLPALGWALLLLCFAGNSGIKAQQVIGNLPELHVEGKYFVDNDGNKVVLHGVMDTPSPYFNDNRWGGKDFFWQVDLQNSGASYTTACKNYFRKLFDGLANPELGTNCNVFRLHLDPCWTDNNNVRAKGFTEKDGVMYDPNGTEVGGEANTFHFDKSRLSLYMKTLYFPIAKYAMEKGMYVIMRPPGVFPSKVKVGDYYNEYLMTVWDIVSKNDSVKKYAGHLMLELGNEPVTLLDEDGNDTPQAMHDFFQPIVEKIRANGFTGIVLAPGTGWQSNYKGYKNYPITGDNIGYAVHDYVGWYGTSETMTDAETAINNFRNSVPVVESYPIVVTEVDWSPECEGTGHWDEHGNWVLSNFGSWATGTTSKWGKAFKAVHDYFGNVSMTLSATGCYIDIDKWIYDKNMSYSTWSKSDKRVLQPAWIDQMKEKGFANADEASSGACWQWYKDWAIVRPEYSDDDLKMQLLSIDKSELSLYPGNIVTFNIICTAVSGRETVVTSKCDFTISGDDVISISNGVMRALKTGTATVEASYTDTFGNVQKVQSTVNVTFFPLTAESINPSIFETGKYVEKTQALTTGQWGFGGWQFAGGIDLSAYKYLVVRLKTKATCSPSFRLFDNQSYWSSPYSKDFGNSTEVKIDLKNMKNDKGDKVDPSHIHIAGFWTTGGTVYIKEIYLIEDETAEVTTAFSDEEQTEAEGVFNILGQPLSQPRAGLNIINGQKVYVK